MTARGLLDRELAARQLDLDGVPRLADALGQVARADDVALASTMARSMVFSSSRTLPGQAYSSEQLARLGVDAADAACRGARCCGRRSGR